MKETIAAGPFAGMNNLLPETKLRRADGPSFVRNAINVDLTEAGSFKRRQGVEQALAGVDCHSFFSVGNTGFFVDGATLYRVTEQGGALVKSSIATVTPGLRMSYAQTGIDVRASNGVQALRIRSDGSVSDWSIPTPQYDPVLTAGSGGSMTAGIYRALFSFSDASGEEGATTFPVSVTVPDGGTLTVAGIPQAAGLTTNVYLTPPNGDEFYRVAQPAGSSLVLTTTPENGVRPAGLLLAPMPPGQIVRFLNGRLLVANGNTLFYSEPHAPGLLRPSRNYIQMPEPITMVEPCVGGFYLSAGKTFWIGGDVASAAMLEVLPYGAIPGTGNRSPEDGRVWWMTGAGLVIGDRSGAVQNVQEKNVAVPSAVVGATLFREQDGMRQMVASLFSPQSTVVSARSFMDAEIIRKETVL